jgi:hypothetical protein
LAVQGLVLARQVIYNLSQVPSPLLYFFNVEERFILAHDFRGVNPSWWEREESRTVHIMVTRKHRKGQEGARNKILPRTYSQLTFPPARCHLLRFPGPLKIAPPAWVQAFNTQAFLGRTLHIQTINLLLQGKLLAVEPRFRGFSM